MILRKSGLVPSGQLLLWSLMRRSLLRLKLDVQELLFSPQSQFRLSGPYWVQSRRKTKVCVQFEPLRFTLTRLKIRGKVLIYCLSRIKLDTRETSTKILFRRGLGSFCTSLIPLHLRMLFSYPVLGRMRFEL